jgi:hypothetical protein
LLGIPVYYLAFNKSETEKVVWPNNIGNFLCVYKLWLLQSKLWLG